MARRTPPPTPQQANIDLASIPGAITKLERRILDLRNAAPTNEDELSSVVDSLCTKINGTLADVFGLGTVEYDRASVSWSRFSVGRVVMSGYGRISWEERAEKFESGKNRTIGLLQSEIELLSERLSDGSSEPLAPEGTLASSLPSSDEVFIVHGHDTGTKEEVARFISKAGLKPVILHEEPNGGRTLIEKFEGRTATIGFAIVLLTPDDVGGPQGGALNPRARQNVIAELFYFMGKLGRSKVCALKKGEVEIPSDIGGVAYTDFDPRGAWKSELLRELEAAGYPVRWEALR